MLKFEHVTKVYGGKKALNDLTLSFLPGHVYALVGPNGSGKSTMMKVAAGLARNADICMLDEPLNGIDLVGRDQIIQSILRAANPNATILISSHLFDELEPIVDHIVMMANGSLILEGELEEIRTRYGKSISDLYREYFSGTAASPLFPNNTNQPTV